MLARYASVILAVVPGCAEVVVDSDAAYCLHWTDRDPPRLPEAAPCALTVRSPSAEVVPPDAADARLAYVCVPASPGGECAAPAVAEIAASTCLESETGDICDGGGFGGSCTSETIWSMCGPDPAAEGGCCYWAWVVTSTILS